MLKQTADYSEEQILAKLSELSRRHSDETDQDEKAKLVYEYDAYVRLYNQFYGVMIGKYKLTELAPYIFIPTKKILTEPSIEPELTHQCSKIIEQGQGILTKKQKRNLVNYGHL